MALLPRIPQHCCLLENPTPTSGMWIWDHKTKNKRTMKLSFCLLYLLLLGIILDNVEGEKKSKEKSKKPKKTKKTKKTKKPKKKVRINFEEMNPIIFEYTVCQNPMKNIIYPVRNLISYSEIHSTTKKEKEP